MDKIGAFYFDREDHNGIHYTTTFFMLLFTFVNIFLPHNFLMKNSPKEERDNSIMISYDQAKPYFITVFLNKRISLILI